MISAWIVAAWIAGMMTQRRMQDFEALGPADFAPPDTWQAILARAVVAGVLSGLIASFLELKVFPKKARRIGAGAMLLVRTLGYALTASLIVLAALYSIATWELGVPFGELLASPGLRAFLTQGAFFRLIVIFVGSSFIINAVLQVWRLLGPGAASQILLGRYLRPVHEDRAFLFIDLADSTGIAERLGPLKFADFKNDFFHDVAEPVLDTKGQIVQYVGDEVMITWPSRKNGGSASGDSVRCFFEVRRHVEANADRYETRYGEVPRFRGGLHSGPVVVSQLGDLKREIVFSGDAVNAAARIQGLCKELGRDFLASTEGVAGHELPDGVGSEELGVHSLRGRNAPVTLLALRTH